MKEIKVKHTYIGNEDFISVSELKVKVDDVEVENNFGLIVIEAMEVPRCFREVKAIYHEGVIKFIFLAHSGMIKTIKFDLERNGWINQIVDGTMDINPNTTNVKPLFKAIRGLVKDLEGFANSVCGEPVVNKFTV